MHRRLFLLLVSGALTLAMTACGTSTPGTDGGGDTPEPATPTPPGASETPIANADEILTDLSDETDEEVLTEQEATPQDPAIFVSNLPPGQPDPALTRDYIDAAIAHLDQVWTAWFLSVNLAEPWVSYTVIMPGEEATSECTDPNTGADTVAGSDYNNAFYCPFDANESDLGAIYLPVDTMGQMWTGDMFNRQVSDLSKVGDYAAALLIAHEFGHHVQDELTEQVGVPKPAGINSEQIADCFAGVWTYSVFLDNYLEPGDIDEAFEALGVIGDQNPLRSSHGSGAQRQNAFLLGYNGSEANPVPGVPANCIVAFWPEWMALVEAQGG